MAMANVLARFTIIIILVRCSECLPLDEPKCSKFDFEEKLLEKMVRMEHSGGVMMKEFREIATNVKDGLESMRQEFDDIKRGAQEERNSSRQMVREYIERPSYAFNANWLSNHDANVGDALIFKNVILNEEDVYNKYTGEYSVKVNGTYTFSATLCFNNNRYANVRFLADDRVLGMFRVGDRDWSLCSSSTTVAYLSKDSRVRVDVSYRSSSSSNIFYDDQNKYHSSFSGHLIK